MYNLKIITDKKTWNDFIVNSNFEFYSFLCSWEWYDLQELSGKKVLKYGIYETHPQPLPGREGSKNSKLIGIIPLIINKAKRGTYLFSPHTPLIKDGFFDVLNEILPEIKNIAKKQKANFIRFNSAVTNSKSNKDDFSKLGFINAPMHEHAEDTHLLKLEGTDDEMLAHLAKKDRYFINRAKKEGVEVRIDNKNDHIEKLIEMHHNHASKVGYHRFSEDFIYNLYKIFDKNISTISTSFNQKIESILMTIKFGKTCVYYIAASDVINKKFSPNYLCQWEAICKAKNDGCNIYNFWGVSPDDNPKHPIAGVTKFKRKFAGYDYSLLHAQDLPLNYKYWFNWTIETIRRKKRGYYYKKPE